MPSLHLCCSARFMLVCEYITKPRPCCLIHTCLCFACIHYRTGTCHSETFKYWCARITQPASRIQRQDAFVLVCIPYSTRIYANNPLTRSRCAQNLACIPNPHLCVTAPTLRADKKESVIFALRIAKVTQFPPKRQYAKTQVRLGTSKLSVCAILPTMHSVPSIH